MLRKAAGYSAAATAPAARDDADYIGSTITQSERAMWAWAGRRDQQEIIAQCVGYTLICAMLVSRYCASVPVRLVTKAKGKPSEKSRRIKAWMRSGAVGIKAVQSAERADSIVEVDDHPLLEVLRRPNPDESGLDYGRFLYLCRMIPGNGYEYVLDPLGENRRLRALFPGNVTIMPGVDTIIGGYRYGRDPGTVRFFSREEIVPHRHMPSLTDPLYGVSPLNAVTLENKTLAAAVYRELASILNDRRPDFAVDLQPGTGQAQIDRLRAYFSREHKGPDKVRLPLIAEGIKVQPYGWSNRDMEAPALIDRFQKAVKDAYGVGDMLDSKGSAGLSIGANGAPDAERRFLRQTVLPEVVAVCETRTDFMLPMFGLDPDQYWLVPDNPVAEDREAMTAQMVQLKQARIVTTNEARTELGFDTIKGGDELDQPPPSPFGITPTDLEAEDEEEPEDEGDEDAAPTKANKAALPRAIHKEVGYGPDEQEDLRVVTIQVDKMRRALRSWFRMYRDEAVAATVETGSPRIDLASRAELVRSFDEATEPPLRALYRIGFNRGVDETDPRGGSAVAQPEELTQDAADYIRRYQGRLIRSVDETTSREIEAALAEGVELQESRQQLGERVAEAMGPKANAYRANLIATTESKRAYESSRAKAWEESGVVEGREWLLSGNPCPVCVAMAQQYNQAQVTAAFAPAGTVIQTSAGPFSSTYADYEPGTVHPGCKCSQRPVFRSVKQ